MSVSAVDTTYSGGIVEIHEIYQEDNDSDVEVISSGDSYNPPAVIVELSPEVVEAGEGASS